MPIASEVDEYIQLVEKKTSAGDLDLELTDASLLAYIERGVVANVGSILKYNTQARIDLIEELRAFGIRTVRQLDELVTPSFQLLISDEDSGDTTDLGVIRDAMMISDFPRYFSDAWQNHWRGLEVDSLETFFRVQGFQKVKELLIQYDINILVDGEPIKAIDYFS